MNDRFQVGIVKIEDMAADAIDEGGVHDIQALASAKQADLPGAGKRAYGGHCPVHGRMVRPADGDANPIEQGADAFLAHACRQVIMAGPDDITRERLGDALGRRD